MKKHKLIMTLKITSIVAAFLLVFTFLNILVTPKYATSLVEGSMLSQYYDEYGDNDVIFVGDCEVYSNYSPIEMYKEKGITSYIRGSSQQLIWQSYYILKETLNYETPKAVVFNVNSMRYSEPVKEEFHRLTIDEMRWSKEKIDIINASMTEEETFISYVFPILRYHSRIFELTSEDFTYMFNDKKNTFNGYLMKTSVKPVENLPTKKPLANYEFSEKCYDYLDMMTELCKEKGVELILVKAPSLYPYWYEEYDAQIEEYAEKNGLAFYNFTENIEEIGIDFSTDTFDAGLHLNHSGATKLSKYFAEILANNHNIPDRRGEDEINKKYAALIKEHDLAALK